jgi:hypothetical protein
LAFAFSINVISLASASRKRVRMVMSKLILASDRRRSRLVPKKNSIWTLRRQSAMVSMLCPHLYSPSFDDSTSAKMCDVKPVDTGERNERLRREKTFFMLATSEESIRENLRVSGQNDCSVAPIERQGDWIRQECSVWLIWSNAVALTFMDQGQRNPFC